MEADMCHTNPGYGSGYVSYKPRLWKRICVMQAQVMEADMYTYIVDTVTFLLHPVSDFLCWAIVMLCACV